MTENTHSGDSFFFALDSQFVFHRNALSCVYLELPLSSLQVSKFHLTEFGHIPPSPYKKINTDTKLIITKVNDFFVVDPTLEEISIKHIASHS